MRPKAYLVILATLMVAGIACTLQQMQLSRMKESQRRITARHEELSTNYAVLLTVVDARDAEILRLRDEALEIPWLRNQLAEARRRVAVAAAENQMSNEPDSTNGLSGYMTKEQLKFAGFGSPTNTLQSMRWACVNGDYTNWLAALSPRLQEEELANPQSLQTFQRDSARDLQGMQVLDAKPVDSDHMELKVRLDTENSVAILIFPMVALGNEWRLGDEIRAYSESWDH
jgi:hypothetical protein